jgi:hypothetical protein
VVSGRKVSSVLFQIVFGPFMLIYSTHTYSCSMYSIPRLVFPATRSACLSYKLFTIISCEYSALAVLFTKQLDCKHAKISYCIRNSSCVCYGRIVSISFDDMLIELITCIVNLNRERSQVAIRSESEGR